MDMNHLNMNFVGFCQSTHCFSLCSAVSKYSSQFVQPYTGITEHGTALLLVTEVCLPPCPLGSERRPDCTALRLKLSLMWLQNGNFELIKWL
jgi:hypothetical protein